MYIVIGRNDSAARTVECDTSANAERCAVILLMREGCDIVAVMEDGETLAMYTKGKDGVVGVRVGDLCVLPNSRKVYGVSKIDAISGSIILSHLKDRRYPNKRRFVV